MRADVVVPGMLHVAWHFSYRWQVVWGLAAAAAGVRRARGPPESSSSSRGRRRGGRVGVRRCWACGGGRGGREGIGGGGVAPGMPGSTWRKAVEVGNSQAARREAAPGCSKGGSTWSTLTAGWAVGRSLEACTCLPVARL